MDKLSSLMWNQRIPDIKVDNTTSITCTINMHAKVSQVTQITVMWKNPFGA